MKQPEDEVFLIIPLDTIQDELYAFDLRGRELLNSKVESNEELDAFRLTAIGWIKSGGDIFARSFNIERNRFANIYSSGVADKIQINGNLQTRDFDQIQTLINNKLYYKSRAEILLVISDVVVNPKILDLQRRNKYTIKEKSMLLLEKLFDAYPTGWYYSIDEIFKGNGVKLGRREEDFAIADILERDGLIEKNDFGRLEVRLTTAGAIELEELSAASTESDYENINKTKEELSKIIVELKDKLNELGFGNEIIYNELQEMKEIFPTLNKKTWGQLVKGKIVDMVVGKVLSADAAKFVYEHITGSALHIPLLGK